MTRAKDEEKSSANLQSILICSATSLEIKRKGGKGGKGKGERGKEEGRLGRRVRGEGKGGKGKGEGRGGGGKGKGGRERGKGEYPICRKIWPRQEDLTPR